MKLHWVLVMAWSLSAGVSAQSVSLNGSLGDKALLVIDGTPHSVRVGGRAAGVRLLSLNGSSAEIEVGGQRRTLGLGGTQVDLGGSASAGGGSQIVLSAGDGGHYFSDGSINGRAVRFMVDTGATLVAMSQTEAERIGVNFRGGQRGMAMTANGAVPVHRVTLNALRVGDVTVYNVDATVVPLPMDQILLGNSFLTRFQVKMENDRMTLDRKP